MSTQNTTDKPFDYKNSYLGQLPPEILTRIFEFRAAHSPLNESSERLGPCYLEGKRRVYWMRGLGVDAFDRYFKKYRKEHPEKLSLDERCHILDIWKEEKSFLKNPFPLIVQKKRQWLKPIHRHVSRVIEHLMNDEDFAYHLRQLHALICLNVDLNSSASNGHTPLTILCKAMNGVEKMELSEKYKQIVTLLLKGGADLNKRGNPSLPLLTLLYTSPLTQDHHQFKMKMLSLFLDYGANPHQPVKKDGYGYSTTPYQYASMHYKAAVHLMPPPPSPEINPNSISTSLQNLYCRLSSLTYQKK